MPARPRFDGVRVEPEEAMLFEGTEGGQAPPPMYLSGAFFQLYITALIAGAISVSASRKPGPSSLCRNATSTVARSQSSLLPVS